MASQEAERSQIFDTTVMATQQTLYRALEPNQIRVLHLSSGAYEDEISCSLHAVDFSHNPEYEALSYTWGNAAITGPIIVNG